MTLSTVASLLVALAPFAGAQESAPEDVAAIAAEVRGAHVQVTAGQWSASHPSDAVEPFSGTKHLHDTEQWCVRFVRMGALPSGTSWKRTAYFFHPPAPPDLRPRSGNVVEVTRDCVLGLVWIEAPPDARATLARAMEELMGKGEALEGLEVRGFGAASWSTVEAWSGPFGFRAIVGRDAGPPVREGAVSRERAFIRISFPASDHAQFWMGDAFPTERAALYDHVRRLAAGVRGMTFVDPRARATMLALLEDHEYWDSERLPAPRAVAAGFNAWLASSRKLRPVQRVDALLLADRLMEFIGHHVRPEGARFAGAEFVDDKLGGAWRYAHSFADEALDIAPRGPARDRALLRLMELGFDHTGMCDAGEDAWERVIAEGEPLIRRSKDPRVLAEAHLMLGDAYATVVDLAAGAIPDYADPAAYREREPEARAKALAHYRAAFALDRSSDAAKRAWRAASRLQAGASPGVYRYFCVYD